jgi:hypothetical protein
MAVSSRRQRGHTKQTSCGCADQLERLTLAAIGHASQCEHDTRNRPGSSIPIPVDSASCPLLPMISRGDRSGAETPSARTVPRSRPHPRQCSVPHHPCVPDGRRDAERHSGIGAVAIFAKILQAASVRAVERAGGGAGDGIAVIARLAGGNALIHVAGIVGTVAAHRAERGRAGDVLLRVAGCRQKRKQGDRKQTHGMSTIGRVTFAGNVTWQPRPRHSHRREPQRAIPRSPLRMRLNY